MNMTLAEVIDILTKTGLLGGLIIALWGGVTGKWVFGWVYLQALADKDAEIERLEREKDELWDLLKHTAGLLDKSTEVAERAATLATAPRPPRRLRP